VFIWSSDVTSSSQSWTPKLLHKFNDVVWHLSWSVTGNILAVSGGDNKVSCSNSSSGGGGGVFGGCCSSKSTSISISSSTLCNLLDIVQ